MPKTEMTMLRAVLEDVELGGSWEGLPGPCLEGVEEWLHGGGGRA